MFPQHSLYENEYARDKHESAKLHRETILMNQFELVENLFGKLW